MTLRARFLNRFLRFFAKPHLARTATPKLARKSFQLAALVGFLKPPFTLSLGAEFPASGGWLTGSWISNRVKERQCVLLYLHGGGYIVGNSKTHGAMLSELSKLSGIQVFAPNYRLAPEHVFPTQFDDAFAAWNYLISLGYMPENIAIGGDSAGGGLALALLGKLCEIGTPPGCVFAMSPWTDLTLSGDSLSKNATSDAILPVKRIEELREFVLQGADPKDARISPLFGQFQNCCPVFLQGSKTEILADDLTRMAQHLIAQGCDVEIDQWDDLPHVWPVFHGRLPEADQALANIASFMKAQFPTLQEGES